jgi:transcriptional regulator with XRE-family HTH domain
VSLAPSTSADLVLLDSEKVKTLRRRLGLSRGELGDRIGAGARTIASIENGTNHEVINGRLIDRLAGALGTTVSGLMPRPVDVSPASGSDTDEDVRADARRLTALYMHAEGNVHNDDAATALGWTRRRLIAAQAVVDANLAGTGLELRRGSWSQLALRPTGGLVNDEELRSLASAQLARRGLHLKPARLLQELQQGKVSGDWEKRVGWGQRALLGRLLDLGLAVERGSGNFDLSGDVRFSLMLDEKQRRATTAGTPATGVRHVRQPELRQQR